MRRYVGETYLTSSYILCYDSFKSDSTADKRSMIGNPDESRCLDPAPMKGRSTVIDENFHKQFKWAPFTKVIRRARDEPVTTSLVLAMPVDALYHYDKGIYAH